MSVGVPTPQQKFDFLRGFQKGLGAVTLPSPAMKALALRPAIPSEHSPYKLAASQALSLASLTLLQFIILQKSVQVTLFSTKFYCGRSVEQYESSVRPEGTRTNPDAQIHGGEPMGDTAISSRSVRRLHKLVEEQVKDPAKVGNAKDEMEEAAERRASKIRQSVRSSKCKGKQAEEEVVMRELMGTNVVDAVSLELGSLKLNNDCYGNSRSLGIVLNTVSQEFVANMERSLTRGDHAANASNSGEGDKDDSVMDLKSATEQGYTSTVLSGKDTTFLAELMQEAVIGKSSQYLI